jgi:SAM-dependent methyltransferase
MNATTTKPLSRSFDLSQWPGARRRHPEYGQRDYLSLSSLARDLTAAVDSAFPGRTDLRVLDIGCGEKPYLPLVAHRAASYRGLDSEPGPYVDDVGGAESLPYEDGSFDLVLCTQVLEHVFEPDTVVREIHRVLAPSGLALVSTHGVHVFHPDPPEEEQDFWRWTHAGLRLLFDRIAPWSSVEVHANGNMIACMTTLSLWYLDGVLAPVPRIRRVLFSAGNRLAEFLDARFPKTFRVPAAGSLAANYLVNAWKR